MSVIKNNPLLKGASGMLGDVIVFRECRGKMIMCNRPKTRGVPTQAQENAKERFQEAVQYAKAQVLDPVSKADYATGINDRYSSAYGVAVADYLRLPEVKLIDASSYTGAAGGTITVKAVDDFSVVSVHVELRNVADIVIEQGLAVMDPIAIHDWVYAAQTANAVLVGTKIIAKAKDKAGNIGVSQIVL